MESFQEGFFDLQDFPVDQKKDPPAPERTGRSLKADVSKYATDPKVTMYHKNFTRKGL